MQILTSLFAVGLLSGLSGCTASDPQNEKALSLIQEYSGRDAKVENLTKTPECDNPRDALLTDEGYPTAFRSKCRVFYSKNGIDRYKDMKCIGDFAKDPMLEYCYVWHPYDKRVVDNNP